MWTKAAGGTAPNESDTLGHLIDAWLEQYDGRLSPTTMREYRRIAARVVIPELGEIKLSKLSAKHLDRLYAKLEAKDNVATTIRGVHALIGAALHQGENLPLIAGPGSRIIGLSVPPAHLREQYGFRSVAFACVLELRRR